MARPPFGDFVRDAQKRGKLILLDGPMGTELQNSGLNLEQELCHRWNLTHRQAVEVVYEDYVNAGADALLTNTFSAHLGYLKDESDWKQAASAGIDIAREPEWDHLYAIGSIGSAVGPDEQAIPAIQEVMGALSSCDALLVETQTRMDRMRELVSGIHTMPPVPPMMISFSYSRIPRQEECWIVESPHGETLEADEVASWAHEHEEDLLALGVNCGTHLRLQDFLSIAKAYRKETSLPLLVKPGVTPSIECEFSPGEFANQVRSLADAGVTLVGGCCGTSPAHISALRREIDRLGLGWQE